MGRSFGGGGGGFSGGGFGGGFSSPGGGGRSFGGGGRSFGGPSHGSPGGGMGGFLGGMMFANLLRGSRSGGPAPDREPDQSGSNGGCGAGCAVIAAAIVLVVALSLILNLSTCDSASIEASTIEREPLPASATVETAYYADYDGGWISNPSELESGMRRFYEKTGVQPYLIIEPNGATTSTQTLQSEAQQAYADLFEDEGHFILVFCDDGAGGYNCGYYVGAQARSVMDGEAVSILSDYLARYYYDTSLSEEQVFSDTFASTADRIMEVTPSPIVPVAICSAVAAVAVVAFLIVRMRARAKKEQAERMEEILSTPLEKFGDQHVEDLAEKYEAASGPAQKGQPPRNV